MLVAAQAPEPTLAVAEALQIWVLMDRRLDFTALTALIELYDIEDPMLLIELLKELASKAATYR